MLVCKPRPANLEEFGFDTIGLLVIAKYFLTDIGNNEDHFNSQKSTLFLISKHSLIL